MPTSVRLQWSAVAAAVLGAWACSNSTTGLPPPGFQGGGPARFFFPITVALNPAGDTLYVANSNFDRSFNSGTLVRLSTDIFETTGLGASVPFPSSGQTDLQGRPAFKVQLLDSFAGNMAFSANSSRVYITTRDHSTLSGAPVDANSEIQCPQDNCSGDALQLGGPDFNMLDPFALQLTSLTLPGATSPSNVILVSNLSQVPTSQDGVGLPTSLAVFNEPAAGTTATPFSKAATLAYKVDLGTPGSNSIAVAPGQQVIVGGCFLLVAGNSYVPCISDPDVPEFYRTNPIRFFFGNTGGAATVNTQNFGALLGGPSSGGGLTNALGVSSDGTKLYVAVTRPNALLVTGLPETGISGPPPVFATIPLAATPGRMLVLPRPPVGGVPRSDLIAISATESDAFLLVDPELGRVVAQLEPIGLQPFGLAATRLPTNLGYRVYVALFNDCKVAAVDVFDDAPEQSVVHSTVGGVCP